MTFRERYNTELSWSNKVLLVELCHNVMQLKHGRKWTMQRTAKVLGVSKSLVCEDLMLAKNELALQCSSRKLGLKLLRDK